jgi:hypothetical protein
MCDRRELTNEPVPSRAKSLTITLLLFLIGTVHDIAFGQTVTTQGNCSPALVRSTVDGSVTINCNVDQQDLTAIAAALNALQTENKLTVQQLQSFLQVTNTILGRILARENSLASTSSTLKLQIARVARFQQEELSLLREASQGTDSVSSSNQSGGVVAGTIVGNVSQSIARDRSKFKTPLQAFYAQGVSIQNEFFASDITDAQIDGATSDAYHWWSTVATWLQANMGAPAEARFENNSDKFSYSWTLSGTHAPGEDHKRGNALNMLKGCLTNLETLINTSDFDPPSP